MDIDQRRKPHLLETPGQVLAWIANRAPYVEEQWTKPFDSWPSLNWGIPLPAEHVAEARRARRSPALEFAGGACLDRRGRPGLPLVL